MERLAAGVGRFPPGWTAGAASLPRFRHRAYNNENRSHPFQTGPGQAARAGKSAVPQTVHTLYTHHYSWLRGWLLRKLGNAFDAADLAQDVFLRVLARRERAAEAAMREPRAYLRTIAHGLVVDHWRRRDLEQAWLEALAAQPEALAPSPELQLELLQALVQIDRMLDTLKPAARKAFLMAQLDGLSCPQIALRLGLSLATVERYIARALRACYALQFEQ